MEILTPDTYKPVKDFDFTLVGGIRFPIVLDPTQGDLCEELPDRYILYLSEKPRPTDDADKMPAEHITIFKTSILAFIMRERQQRIQTPEESFNMKSTIAALAKGIH